MEDMIGFRGVLMGRILRKPARGFVMKQNKMNKVVIFGAIRFE
jgi:hypothetical protein